MKLSQKQFDLLIEYIDAAIEDKRDVNDLHASIRRREVFLELQEELAVEETYDNRNEGSDVQKFLNSIDIDITKVNRYGQEALEKAVEIIAQMRVYCKWRVIQDAPSNLEATNLVKLTSFLD